MKLSQIVLKIESEIEKDSNLGCTDEIVDRLMKIIMKYTGGKESPVRMKDLIENCYWRTHGC